MDVATTTVGSDLKFRLVREDFAEAVAWVARNLPTRPTVPVLAGVRDARTRLVTGTRARLDTAAGTLTVLAAEDDDVRAQV